MRQRDQFTGLPLPLPLETIRPLAMGVAYAALMPTRYIQRRLNCSVEDAVAFQETAMADFQGLMFSAQQAKARRP